MNTAAAFINEPTITLTYSQLQEMLENAAEKGAAKAIEQLAAEFQEIKTEMAAKDQLVTNLQARISAVENTQVQETDRLCLDIAHDRRRISQLENEEAESTKVQVPGAKVKGHLNAIYDALEDRERSCKGSARKWDFMTFWEVSELLGLSHRRISQLANIAKNDPRFVIGWHAKRKNAKVFKLNPFRSMGHAAKFMNELQQKVEG